LKMVECLDAHLDVVYSCCSCSLLFDSVRGYS
jgi:hypothetical protein